MTFPQDASAVVKSAALAGAFAAILYRDLSPAEWAKMRAKNASAYYSEPDGPCASHDQCDANMAMLEAIRIVTGDESHNGLMSPDDVDLWNAGWRIAKAEFLTDRASLDDLAEEFQDFCEREGFAEGDAEELLAAEDVSDIQRAWLSRFVARWDALEAERDLAETVRAHGA